jgi:type IV secretion system protein VirB2
MTMAPSLFDTPQSPPLSSAAGWLTGAVSGSVAVILCVLAVAFVGLLLMSGRLALRDAGRVALACFVVLGASTIAAGLRGAAVAVVPMSHHPETIPVAQLPPPPPLPPANYDPYAGASLRSD